MLETHIRLSLTDPMTVLSVSDGVEALLGFKPDDFLAGKVSLENLIHVHDQDIAADLFSTGANKTSGTFNIRLRQANGRIRCIKGHYTKEPGASGKGAILELHLQDAKSLWQGLGDQPMMANFKAMMENTDDYIYFKDRNHVFNGASQTLVAITEPSEHWTDLLGLTDYDVFPEEYADVYYRLEKQVFAGIPVAHEIQETLDNDGNKGWVDNRKYPIKDANGEIIGLFGIARDITEQKLAEEKLQRTQFASDHAPDCIFWCDKQARFHYANDAACRELGYTKEELLAMSVPDIDPDMPAAAWTAHWQELQQKNTVTIETRHRRKDGSIFPAEVSANFVRFGDQEFNVAFTRDITKRKQQQALLEASRKHFETLFDSANDGMFIIDMQGNIRHANRTVCERLGYSREELLAMPLAELDTPEFAARIPERMAQITKHGMAVFETAHYRKNGSIMPVEINSRVIELEGEKVFMGVIRDITERKQIEEALRIAATAFESQESMVITDAKGVILQVNQAFTEATGYTAEEAVGQTPRLLKSGRQDADFYREMWGTLLRTGKWQGEIWDKRKNGEIYPKLLTISAVKGEDGIVTHYVGSDHDITKRKAAEGEIHNLAFYDSLTQLPNRRLLDDRLGKIMATSKRSGHYAAVMFLDLDNFKPLNDEHGHGVGDLLLVEAARRIARCVREVDTVARFGGDEFVVVLSELDEDKAESTAQAGIVAEKIRVTLAEPYVLKVQPEGKKETTVEHLCTSSIGVVLFINHETSEEDILKWADMAMYQAKEAGRNQVRFYESKD